MHGGIMALISCVECHKEVSDRANSCPACGNPVRAPAKSELDKLIGVFKSLTFIMIWVLVLGAGLIFFATR